MLNLVLLLQVVAGPVAPTPAPTAAPEDRCVALMRQAPAATLAAVEQWERAGGGAAARQCLGLAHNIRGDFAGAAAAFERAGEVARTNDERRPTFWSQAGNAWLAAGQPAKAAFAFERALGSPHLTGFERGEVELDRARALERSGDRPGARLAIDRALPLAGDDPLAWLLSATLARQMGDPARAKADIAQAIGRAPDDASVQLEAGNIAAQAGDEAGAKAAWTEAVKLRPDSPQAKAAQAALAQFDAKP